VPDLAQAGRAAQQLLPQAVVIDSNDRSLETTRLPDLARQWGLPHTPFMACPLPGEGWLRGRLAVDGYLVKPISRQALWDVLRRFGDGVERVLLIDDDDEFVQLLERMLDSPVRHYRVTTAYSGQEGLTLIGRSRPDLVLLDLRLPDLPGEAVAQRIRSMPEFCHTPIVIISAQDEPEPQESLAGDLVVSTGTGLAPGEVVGWVQYMLDCGVKTAQGLQERPTAAPR
jgi:CheY-like chemotaxis protein